MVGVDGPDGVRALDARDGMARWCRSYRGNTYGPAGLMGMDGVFVTQRGKRLTALGASDGASADGAVRWTNPLEQPIGLGAGTLISGKALSLDMPPARFELRALDLATGQPRWAHEVDGTEAAVVGDVVAVRNVIDRERFDAPSVLAGYDVATGERRWDRELTNGTMVRAAGRLVLAPAADATSLAAIDPETGHQAWSVHMENPGRSDSHDRGSLVVDLAYDEETDTAFLLLQAQEPYRD